MYLFDLNWGHSKISENTFTVTFKNNIYKKHTKNLRLKNQTSMQLFAWSNRTT